MPLDMDHASTRVGEICSRTCLLGIAKVSTVAREEVEDFSYCEGQ